jgi:hypothetical protein
MKFGERVEKQMFISSNIWPNQKTPARPERYPTFEQPGSSNLVDGLATVVGPTKRGRYCATLHDCPAVLFLIAYAFFHPYTLFGIKLYVNISSHCLDKLHNKIQTMRQFENLWSCTVQNINYGRTWSEQTINFQFFFYIFVNLIRILQEGYLIKPQGLWAQNFGSMVTMWKHMKLDIVVGFICLESKLYVIGDAWNIKMCLMKQYTCWITIINAIKSA